MNEGFELRISSHRGDGVFATRAFKAGEITMRGIIEKVLDGNHSHASQIGENVYVLHAGLISKVNHSCEPNCGIRVNTMGAHDFIAMKEILADDEITFDYATRNYNIDHFPKVCMCGARKCRGSITGWKDLTQFQKMAYFGYLPKYLIELDAKNLLAKGASAVA